MSVKCSQCGHEFPDSVIKQKCFELQTDFSGNLVEKLRLHGIKLWLKASGNDTGADILNSYNHPCPGCHHTHSWI